jgi:hypothetical protein
MKLFSKRHAKIEDVFRYDIPVIVRNRLLHTLKHCVERGGRYGIRTLFSNVDNLLLRQNGHLRPRDEKHEYTGIPVIDHFYVSPDEEVMDFLQVCFRWQDLSGGQPTVDAINDVLEEENVGFELTPYIERQIDGYLRVSYPTVLKKDEKLLHKETVKPCLHLLGDSRFKTASDELLKAFEEYRKGNYADAVTDAGSAFESVLKTICTIKHWYYEPDRATCSYMVGVCREKGLFHPFYAPILESVGTIRNKIADAHGRGPAPEFPPAKELADHMLYMVCNNIVLVITLAKL